MRGFPAGCRAYWECQPSFLVPPKTSASLLTAKAIAGELKGSCATLNELSKYERVRHIFSLSQLLGIEIVWKPWPGSMACLALQVSVRGDHSGLASTLEWAGVLQGHFQIFLWPHACAIYSLVLSWPLLAFLLSESRAVRVFWNLSHFPLFSFLTIVKEKKPSLFSNMVGVIGGQ